MTLDEIASKYKTDKGSNLHNYTEKYDMYFSRLRNEPIKILEIGIQNGYSLKTWKEYFPNAQIFGIDIVDCAHMDEERIKTLKGSQTDIKFLQKINESHGPFDIIIDDGSHYSSDMTISFDTLFPLLKPDGLYVVEDLHCVYWPQFMDGGRSFMRRLSRLMNSVNGRGRWGLSEIKNESRDEFYEKRKNGEPDWWDRAVEYVHLYRSIVFVKKYEGASMENPQICQSYQIWPKAWRFLEKVWRKVTKKA